MPGYTLNISNKFNVLHITENALRHYIYISSGRFVGQINHKLTTAITGWRSYMRRAKFCHFWKELPVCKMLLIKFN